MNRVDKNFKILMYQILTLYKASLQGWRITKVGNNKYELNKKIDDIENFDLQNFILDISKV